MKLLTILICTYFFFAANTENQQKASPGPLKRLLTHYTDSF